jgi:hypothetical protein
MGMNPRKKQADPDVIRGLEARLDLLLKNGMVTKDHVINTEEASAITGLSPNTLCKYAQCNHIGHYKYPGKNMYPLKELCLWVEQHYVKATVTTSEMNGYHSVKMGRPRKRKGACSPVKNGQESK